MLSRYKGGINIHVPTFATPLFCTVRRFGLTGFVKHLHPGWFFRGLISAFPRWRHGGGDFVGQ